jgi:hypothetical protein
MRKHLIAPISKDAPAVNIGWLELDREAVVEFTSEEKEYPVWISLCLTPGADDSTGFCFGHSTGWHAR